MNELDAKAKQKECSNALIAESCPALRLALLLVKGKTVEMEECCCIRVK